MSALAVFVPLKPFDRAKSRLGSRFDGATRARIAEALARRTLGRIAEAFPDAARFVVGEPALTPFALANGATLCAERAGLDRLGPILDAALDASEAARALVVMGDLPDVAVDDLRALAAYEADVALAEGVDGHGTNALCLRLPRRFALAFAEPGSCDLHERRASDAGLAVRRARLASLARDLDRPSDLGQGELDALFRD